MHTNVSRWMGQLGLWAVGVAVLPAQPVGLPELAVYAPRVALEEPVGVVTMPISALRYEPLVDVQARNLAEGQADVSIRGGLFEQTGFRIGALSLFDPQTGHYFAEIPIAPAFLEGPRVLTGYANAAQSWNAGAGSVAYRWRPVKTGGAMSVSAGQHRSSRAEWYQGYRDKQERWGGTLGADVAYAFSESDGTIAGGDHAFRRINVRTQWLGKTGQTDVFAGYQSKKFGWPNLYTPFNSFESENLQTVLVSVHHRETWDQGDYLDIGGYYRRNKDDYAFNRFAPLGPIHPFQHTSWVYAAGVDARRTVGGVIWTGQAVAVADELESTSLTAGRFRDRSYVKLGFGPERTWRLTAGRTLTARAGLSLDDSNRDGSAVSPRGELVLDQVEPGLGLHRLHVSYAKATQTATYTALNSAAGAGLFRGNPNLGRQVAHTMELGAAGTWGGWTTTAAVFFRQDDRLVDWTYRTGVTARTANPVDLGTTGFECVARRSTERMDWVVGYTAFSKDADYGTSLVDASFYALNYPRHRLTLAATVRLGAGWELRWDNEVRLQAENALRRSSDDAWLSAIGVYYAPRAWRGVKVSLQVDNLWDDRFEEVPAVPAGRRQGSLGLSYAY